MAVAVLAGCAQNTSGSSPGSPSPAPSVSSPLSPTPAAPTPALPDYNARFGSNRYAAEAAVALGRQLYSQGGQYWELNVRTDPPSLGGVYDPVAPGPPARAVAGAKSVAVFMATESAVAISLFRAGGVAHEKAEVSQAAALVAGLFPGAASVTIQVYFGEANLYATAVYRGGSLDYRPAVPR